MAEKYKSVLEKYNDSLKPRFPTAAEEAIEPVYPEEYLIGGPGKAVVSGLRSGAEKTAVKAAQRERIASAKIGSRVPDPEAVAAEKAVSDKFYKSDVGRATYEDLKNQAEQTAKAKTINKIQNATEQAGIGSANNLYGGVGWDIGSQMAENKSNAAGDTYKKGGKIKSTASSRGDGIAKRGKTKGRMV
jgi:sugar-specific transcriptional regulator TrmB